MKAGIFAAALFVLAALVGDASAQPGGEHRSIVVVELYTSQGCPQCPRANRLLGMMARQSNVLALTFPVGIWDYLGWRDTLARPEYTTRQAAYSERLHVRGRFTPQLVLNGAQQLSAGDWDTAQSVLEDAMTAPRAPGAPDVAMTRVHNRVRVTIGTAAVTAPADIWLVSYDPGPVAVYIAGGLNINRTVQHYNLVRALEHVDQWNGEERSFETTHCDSECAILIQQPNGGPIIAAAYTSLRPHY